jgi:hypothetical protein
LLRALLRKALNKTTEIHPSAKRYIQEGPHLSDSRNIRVPMIMVNRVEPTLLDQWFPPVRQQYYVERLLQERRGLTRLRAEYFIRLWAYLMLKQQGKLPKAPITELVPVEGSVCCTHQEAADLFYTGKERGSDRAAGMMINQLISLGLVSKQFDGNTTTLRIWTLSELIQPSSDTLVSLNSDQFNPRTDVVPVASFLARNYSWLNSNTASVIHKIAKVLRQWAQDYPQGMRVLRRADNLQPVGFYVLFPVDSASEENFFLPPSLSLHLSTVQAQDPIQMAKIHDPDCLSVFVRSWMVDTPFMQHAYVSQFLKDAQAVLLTMQQDFPNLCDLYSLAIHPSYEAIAQGLGFCKTVQDPHSSLCWMHLALDRFLELDIESVVSKIPML